MCVSECVCVCVQLTEFILDPKLHDKVLATQGQTWDYLEDIFGGFGARR